MAQAGFEEVLRPLSVESLIIDEATCIVIKPLLIMSAQQGKAAIEDCINSMARLALRFDKCFFVLLAAESCE